MNSKSKKMARCLLTIVVALALATPFALAAGRRALPPQMLDRVDIGQVSHDVVIERPHVPITPATSIFVTSTDPAGLLGDTGYTMDARAEGPFQAHDTLNVYIVAMFDRALVVDGACDQITRFILPDGSVYETRVTPIDLESEPGEMIKRADLASHPVPIVKPSPVRTISSILPSYEKSADLRQQVFTSVILPVSGTWITKHNLYGTWVVEVSLVRDGEVLTTAQKTFDIGIDF